jgi:nitrate reductase gamma subunit
MSQKMTASGLGAQVGRVIAWSLIVVGFVGAFLPPFAILAALVIFAVVTTPPLAILVGAISGAGTILLTVRRVNGRSLQPTNHPAPKSADTPETS